MLYIIGRKERRREGVVEMIKNLIFSLIYVLICIIIFLNLNRRKKKEEEDINRIKAEYSCFGKFLIENKCNSCKVYEKCKIKYMDYKNINFEVCSKVYFEGL